MNLEAVAGGPEWLIGALEWIQAHPVEAALVLALASAVEGLFLIGMIIPGSLLMFSAGAIAVAGEIPLWPVILIAALGAWLGDCLSYYIGWRFRAQLPGIASKLRMPSAISRGERFFARHGGKSIFLGRFIGPLRPLVPAIAGAASMRPAVFVSIDAIAALIWAPAYALPGVLVGATLSLAAEITGRLAALMGLALLSVWLLWWLITFAVRMAQRYAEPWLIRTMDWSHKHRRLGNLGPALTDPDQPETPVLISGLAVLCTSMGLLGWIWWYWPGSLGTPAIDDTVYDTLASMLNVLSGPVALHVDALGSLNMNLLLGAALLSLFALRGRSRMAAHWMAGLVGGSILGLCLPGSDMAIGPDAILSPTANLGLLLSLWMCLAGFIATRHHAGVRIAIYVSAGLILGCILLAKLMLGYVSFSQCLLAIPFILIWSSLLTLGFRRHLRRPQQMQVAAPIVLCLLVLMAGLWFRPPPVNSGSNIAWEHAERSPARVNLHWIGQATDIAQSLQAESWAPLTKPQKRDFVSWILPKISEADLPPAPQWLAGRRPDLRYQMTDADGRRLILRLWRDQNGRWLGQVGELKLRYWAGLMRVPVTRRTEDAMATLVKTQNTKWTISRTRRETTLYIFSPPQAE